MLWKVTVFRSCSSAFAFWNVRVKLSGRLFAAGMVEEPKNKQNEHSKSADQSVSAPYSTKISVINEAGKLLLLSRSKNEDKVILGLYSNQNTQINIIKKLYNTVKALNNVHVISQYEILYFARI